MNVISLIKSLRILDYYVVESKCSNSPNHADAIAAGQVKSRTDAALDSTVTAYQENDGYTEFNTSSVVEFFIKLVDGEASEEEPEKEAISLELSFVTRFRIDATEAETREFLEENDWVFRQRNATLSHFLGGQVIDKTAFDLGLPMN